MVRLGLVGPIAAIAAGCVSFACIQAPPRPADASIDGAIDSAIADAPPIDASLVDALCIHDDAGSSALDVYGGRPGELGGTHLLNTTITADGQNRLALVDGTTSGVWDSPVFDGCQVRPWSRVAWMPGRPSLKQLPGDKAVEPPYPLNAGADMTGNSLLLRFDDDAAGAFADASGWLDSSGAPHVLSCMGGGCPELDSDGAFHRAYKFDATAEDYGRLIVDADGENLEPALVTVEAWIRVDAEPAPFTRGMIVTKGHATPAMPPFDAYSIEVNPSNAPPFMLPYPTIRCYAAVSPTPGGAANDQILDGDNPVSLGEWTHVACVYDGAALRLYVDGALDRSVSFAGVLDYDEILGGDNDVLVGAFAPSSQHFNGSIDELAIYTRALSLEEIQNHYLRRALRVRLQVRSCAEPCPAETLDPPTIPFVGPDGTPNTFFTEACISGLGPEGLNLNQLDCDGDSFPDAPGGVAVLPNRYAQVRVFLDRDDGVPISPLVEQVGVAHP